MTKRIFAILLLVVTLFSCIRPSYNATNKAYKTQARNYADILKTYPLADTVFGTTDFVGTTNFGMRKPNFVIIHIQLKTVASKRLEP